LQPLGGRLMRPGGPPRPAERRRPVEDVSVRPVDPASPAAAELLAALDRLLAARYPPARLHLTPAADLPGAGAGLLGALRGGRRGGGWGGGGGTGGGAGAAS